MRLRRVAVLTVALLTGVAVTSCGSQATQLVGTFTVSRVPTSEATQAPTTPSASLPVSAGPGPALVAVPDGVGSSYLSAWRLWLSAGLSVLRPVDALGAGRVPVNPSEWVVVGQQPAAGSKVPAGATVTPILMMYGDR